MKHLCNGCLNRWLPLQSIPTPLQEASTPILPTLSTLLFVNTFLMPVQFDQIDLYHKHILEILRTKSSYFFYMTNKKTNKRRTLTRSLGLSTGNPGSLGGPCTFHCSHQRGSPSLNPVGTKPGCCFGILFNHEGWNSSEAHTFVTLSPIH